VERKRIRRWGDVCMACFIGQFSPTDFAKHYAPGGAGVALWLGDAALRSGCERSACCLPPRGCAAMECSCLHHTVCLCHVVCMPSSLHILFVSRSVSGVGISLSFPVLGDRRSYTYTRRFLRYDSVLHCIQNCYLCVPSTLGRLEA